MIENKRKLPLFLDQKDIENLTKNIKKSEHRLGLFLMAYGGLRVSELCSLKVSDINLSREFFTVTGKGNKERIIPISAPLRKELESFFIKRGSDLNVNSSLVGRTRSTWHYVVKKYSKQNLKRSDIHCHTLRHSFATLLYEKDVPIERISQLLGHTQLNTTMIYSHISLKKKKEAVSVLDNSNFFSKLFKRKRLKVSLLPVNSSLLVGRQKELNLINSNIEKKISMFIFGPRGCGKSAIFNFISNSVIIHEFKKKQTFINLLLSVNQDNSELQKELKKLSLDSLIDCLSNFSKVIIFDDISELSKTDRKTISKLSQVTTVIAAGSRSSDKKLFKTFIDLKPLGRAHTRQIISDMIQINNPRKKEIVVDDILHQAGDNLKDAEYISSQLSLGKENDDIQTSERESNQVSIAPVLLIFVLFFIAYVLKSYATSMVAFSYALLIVFRLVFYRYLFMPASSKR